MSDQWRFFMGTTFDVGVNQSAASFATISFSRQLDEKPAATTRHSRILCVPQFETRSRAHLFSQTVSFLTALSQLCHSNTELAHHTWLDMFPRIWKLLNERQQGVRTAVFSK